MAKKSSKRRAAEDEQPTEVPTTAEASTPAVIDEEFADEFYADEVIERSVVRDDPDAAQEAAAVKAAMPEHFEDVTPEEQPSSPPDAQDAFQTTPPIEAGPSFETTQAYSVRPLRSGLEEADWFQNFRARLFQSASPEPSAVSGAEPEHAETPERRDSSAAEPAAVAEQDLQTLD